MSLLHVTFNISDIVKKESCRDYLMSKDNIEINDSSFIIKSTQAIELMQRELSQYLTKDDKLFISKIKEKNWTSLFLGRNRRTWIEDNC